MYGRGHLLKLLGFERHSLDDPTMSRSGAGVILTRTESTSGDGVRYA